jgi:hypothetical protein
VKLLGFDRHFDGCEYETPTVQSISLWRWFAELTREAGFRMAGWRASEYANKLSKEQAEIARMP